MKARMMAAVAAAGLMAGGFAVYAVCVRCERIGVAMADLADRLQAVCSVLGALAMLAILAVLAFDFVCLTKDVKNGPDHRLRGEPDGSGHVRAEGLPRDRGAETPSCGGGRS